MIYLSVGSVDSARKMIILSTLVSEFGTFYILYQCQMLFFAAVIFDYWQPMHNIFLYLANRLLNILG